MIDSHLRYSLSHRGFFILEKNRLKAVCSPNGGDEGSPIYHSLVTRKELTRWIRRQLK